MNIDHVFTYAKYIGHEVADRRINLYYSHKDNQGKIDLPYSKANVMTLAKLKSNARLSFKLDNGVVTQVIIR